MLLVLIWCNLRFLPGAAIQKIITSPLFFSSSKFSTLNEDLQLYIPVGEVILTVLLNGS
jgi:hypothetical protein